MKISPSIDERTIEHFLPKVGGKAQPDEAIGELAGAVKYLREQLQVLAALDEAAALDKSQARELAMLEVARAGRRTAERVAKRLDASRAKAKAEIAAIETRTSAPLPPRDAAAIALEQEIRTALRAMPEKERRDTISQAFVTRHEATIGAVLRGPGFLLGEGREYRNLLRQRYREEFHEDELERLKRLNKALEAADRVGELFVAAIREATDSPRVRLAAAAQTQREQAAAAHAAAGE